MYDWRRPTGVVYPSQVQMENEPVFRRVYNREAFLGVPVPGIMWTMNSAFGGFRSQYRPMKDSPRKSISARALALCASILNLGLMSSVYASGVDAAGIDAQALYQKHCSACHGEKGDGHSRASIALNPPPRDFSSPEAWRQLSRERMLTSATYGRPGTAMVGFGNRLEKSEIAAIVDYVRSQFMRPPTVKERSAGDAIYREHCAVCHGDKGAGAQWTRFSLNPPPRDFTAPASKAELNRERMITSVTYGRPGTAMMAFSKRLSPAQVETVVDYVRGTFMGEGNGASTPAVAAGPSHGHQGTGGNITPQVAAIQPVDMNAPMPFGLQPDVAAGRSFFMANCFTCHGRKGDGKGPRSRFIKPPPRDFLSANARKRYNRPTLFRAIAIGKPGTVMPAWSKVLDEQQIADVAEFVYSAFIRPGADEAADKKKP